MDDKPIYPDFSFKIIINEITDDTTYTIAIDEGVAIAPFYWEITDYFDITVLDGEIEKNESIELVPPITVEEYNSNDFWDNSNMYTSSDGILDLTGTRCPGKMISEIANLPFGIYTIEVADAVGNLRYKKVSKTFIVLPKKIKVGDAE